MFCSASRSLQEIHESVLGMAVQAAGQDFVPASSGPALENAIAQISQSQDIDEPRGALA